MIRYRFYPSLLNAYQDYLDAEKTWEKFWGGSDDPDVTLEEYVSKAESELIDKINRVDHEPIEAADRGTCFNEIVDRINRNGEPLNRDVEVRTSKTVLVVDGAVDLETGKPTGAYEEERCCPHIEACMDGFCFRFDITTCKDAARYFSGCIPQHLCSATIDTDYGEVELYGYADEIRQDKVFDIKTTGKYEYGKYGSGWQKDLYPYCLTASGEMEGITEFEYTVFVLGKKEPITGKMYRESYPYVHERSKERLRLICESFIEFLQIHRELISDKKIFNYL